MLPTIRNNRHYAILVLSVTAVCLLYYSLWVLGLPFVDEEYLPAVSWLFPAIHLAFVVPLGLGTAVFMALFCRVFYLVTEDKRQELRLRSKL